jgi:hypothetical protein
MPGQISLRWFEGGNAWELGAAINHTECFDLLTVTCHPPKNQTIKTYPPTQD